MKEINLRITKDGDIYRVEDKKHIANVKEDGSIKYANPVYAKGTYKAAIANLLEAGPTPDEPEPVKKVKKVKSSLTPPPRDPMLGTFSADHINFDHANLSDEDFKKKYQSTAECQLEWTAERPELFADLEALEDRLSSIQYKK